MIATNTLVCLSIRSKVFFPVRNSQKQNQWTSKHAKPYSFNPESKNALIEKPGGTSNKKCGRNSSLEPSVWLPTLLVILWRKIT